MLRRGSQKGRPKKATYANLGTVVLVRPKNPIGARPPAPGLYQRPLRAHARINALSDVVQDEQQTKLCGSAERHGKAGMTAATTDDSAEMGGTVLG